MGKHKKIRGFWDRMDEVIYESGLPKTEIARRCGFSRLILSGRTYDTMLSSVNLATFCSIMHVSADYILGLKQDKELKGSREYE